MGVMWVVSANWEPPFDDGDSITRGSAFTSRLREIKLVFGMICRERSNFTRNPHGKSELMLVNCLQSSGIWELTLAEVVLRRHL